MKYIKTDTRGQSVQSDKTGQVGVTLSPNVGPGARQAQNSPLLQAKQLRRSGLFPRLSDQNRDLNILEFFVSVPSCI